MASKSGFAIDLCRVFWMSDAGNLFINLIDILCNFTDFKKSMCAFMYQSIPSLTILPGNFFDGQIPHTPGKKELKTPTPWAYKNELNLLPPRGGAFFSIIHYKNMKR